MLNIRIKKYLNDIIDQAYPDFSEERRKVLKGFRVYILPKEKKSVGGYCYYAEEKLEIFNVSLGEKFLLSTCLHELSHHLDYKISHNTGHGPTFYEHFAKLIYATLDMGIFTPDTFSDEWGSDSKKIKKIISQYVPHPVEYTPDFPPVIKNAVIYNNPIPYKGKRQNILSFLLF